jgi:hypothetical protein
MAWVTVEEANAYFTDTLEADSWGSLTNKLGAITSAFRILSTHPAYSFPETPTQKMADANAQYALYIATNSSNRQKLIEQGVKSFTVGKFSETLKDTDEGYGTNVKLPSIVKQLLDEYEQGPSFIGNFDRPSGRYDFY